MLVFFRNFEELKNQNKHKQIIDRKCLFYPIGSLKFREIIGYALRFIQNKINNSTENHCQRNPHYTPRKSFFVSYYMGIFVENSQIEQEHNEHCNSESDDKCGVID